MTAVPDVEPATTPVLLTVAMVVSVDDQAPPDALSVNDKVAGIHNKELPDMGPAVTAGITFTVIGVPKPA